MGSVTYEWILHYTEREDGPEVLGEPRRTCAPLSNLDSEVEG